MSRSAMSSSPLDPWARPRLMWCRRLSWRRVTMPLVSTVSRRTLKWASVEAGLGGLDPGAVCL